MKKLIRGLMILICTMFVEFAHAADTAEFTVTTTPDTTSFGFTISAAGEFTIDWGDGTVETITKSDTTNTTHSHTYSSAGAYNIGISGDATAYNTSTTTAAISFYKSRGVFQTRVANISGSLGAIFPTLSNGTNPRFYRTFMDCKNLTGSIPENLFTGITGSPVENMFYYTFYNCSLLTGYVDADMFLISGDIVISAYTATFAGTKMDTNCPAGTHNVADPRLNIGEVAACRTGNPPEPVFTIITAPGTQYFNFRLSAMGIFYIDWGDGDIQTITKDNTEAVYYGHTYLSSGTHEIGFSGYAIAYNTSKDIVPTLAFIQGTKIKSISGSLGAIFGTLPDGTNPQFSNTFMYQELLTSIPDALFDGITGAPTTWMFYQTFYGCSSLAGYVHGNMFKIPADGYSYMYYNTFSGASKMYTVCPAGTYAVEKPDPNWEVAVCSPCPDGLTSPENSQSIDACVPERCAISLRARAGVTIPTYPTRRTVPAIAITYGDDMCYIDVEKTKRGKYIIRAESK